MTNILTCCFFFFTLWVKDDNEMKHYSLSHITSSSVSLLFKLNRELWSVLQSTNYRLWEAQTIKREWGRVGREEKVDEGE